MSKPFNPEEAQNLEDVSRPLRACDIARTILIIASRTDGEAIRGEGSVSYRLPFTDSSGFRSLTPEQPSNTS